MSKQEEIRGEIISLLFGVCMHITDSPDEKCEEILNYLHSQGVKLSDGSNLID